MPFPRSKTIRDLEIDIARKFIVVDDEWAYFKKGDILVLHRNDNSTAPWFRRLSDDYTNICLLSRLEYYNENNSNYSNHSSMCSECVRSNSDIFEFLKNQELTEDDVLLKELSLEDPVGVPTGNGLRLAQLLVFKEKRQAIVELARKMKEAEEAKKAKKDE